MKLLDAALGLYPKIMKHAQRRISNKWDAQDAVQEFYLELVRKQELTDKLKIDMPEAYAMTIAKNLITECIGKSYKHKRIFQQIKLLDDIRGWVMVDYGTSLDMVKRVEKAFRVLKGKRKDVLELVALGWTVPEIARYTALSEKTVDTHAKRARRILRDRQV